MDSSGVGAYFGPRPPRQRTGRTADRPEPTPGRAAHARPGPHNLRLNGGNTDEDAQSGKNHLCGPLRQRGASPARRWRRFWCSWTPLCLSWLISKPLCPEAVTNCIVHAYPDQIGPITMTAAIYEGGIVRITVSPDRGVGIPDVALRPWNRCSPQATPRNARAWASLSCRALWIRSKFPLAGARNPRDPDQAAGCPRVIPLHI